MSADLLQIKVHTLYYSLYGVQYMYAVVISLHMVHVHFFLISYLGRPFRFHKIKPKSVMEGDTTWSRGLLGSKRVGG